MTESEDTSPSASQNLLVALTLVADAFVQTTQATNQIYKQTDLDSLKKIIKTLHGYHPFGIYATYPPDWDDIKPKPISTTPCPTCGKH